VTWWLPSSGGPGARSTREEFVPITIGLAIGAPIVGLAVASWRLDQWGLLGALIVGVLIWLAFALVPKWQSPAFSSIQRDGALVYAVSSAIGAFNGLVVGFLIVAVASVRRNIRGEASSEIEPLAAIASVPCGLASSSVPSRSSC
jgi:hypothetical protein